MKRTLTILAITLTSVLNVNSQTKETIAISEPAVQGLNISPKTTTKLMNIELTKIGIYNVYDEYDMAEAVKNRPDFTQGCLGLNCLTALGSELNVNYVLSGSIDKLGGKIAFSLKIIDVKAKAIHKTFFKEFDNQEYELQRMLEIALREMHNLPNDKETVDRLSFKNEMITSAKVGKINNSGPRIGYAYLNGSLNEFATRSESQGGMDIFPAVSIIGYQFEKQYVGTENFSALFETFVSLTGLEQSTIAPSIAFMNGFRFGKSGWEFAFGPSFGLKKESTGFFDANNSYGNGQNAYWTDANYETYDREKYEEANPYNSVNQSTEFNTYLNNYHNNKTESLYQSSKHLDNRGNLNISTRFVFGIGRTFRTGALNIPVNLFYTSVKKGSMVGVSVGFNVIKKKENINPRY
jgi:hypothetical protein